MVVAKSALAVLLGSLALISSGPAPAQQPARAVLVQRGSQRPIGQEARVALVIGNGAYPDAPLRNPVNDARAMKSALEACGFEATLLADASKRDMENAIRDFGDRIRNGAVGLFYFAGRGIQVKGINYLVPVGANLEREDEVVYQAVEAGQVLDKMDSAKNRLNIMILDACRNNPFSRNWRGGGDRGLAQVNAPTGSFIAFATAPGREAADGKGEHGLYTEALLAQLREPGLELEKVFKRTREKVMAASLGQQTPWESNSTVGDFCFVPAATATRTEPAPQSVQAREALGPPPPAIALIGGLQVLVNAPGTKIYVDGKLSGEASPTRALNLADVPVGEVRVKAEAAGYLDRELPVTIQEGQWVQARLVLAKRAAVEVRASAATAPPPGAVPPARAAAPSAPPAAALPGAGAFQNRFGMVFAPIPAGRFAMGDPSGERDEKPVHSVTIALPFAMQTTHVTVKQWQAFVDATGYVTTMESSGGIRIHPHIGNNDTEIWPYSWRAPGLRQQADHPVVCISWDDAHAFIRWLNQEDPGKGYRLPTEAEWEYACRAGTKEPAPKDMDGMAWFWDNSGETTHPVAGKAPNPWGLYDMLGNAAQLCEDWYGAGYYAVSPEVDPHGPPSGVLRVARGGDWRLTPGKFRPSFRNFPDDDRYALRVGFRLVMAATPG